MRRAAFSERLEEYAMRFAVVVSCVVTVIACSDPAVDDGFVWANHGSCSPTAVSLSAARHDSLPAYPSGPPLSYDDWFYLAAQHTPGGFGGLYLEPVNGGYRTVLMFVDTTNASAELDSLTLYYPGWHSPFARDSVRLRLVRWNWVQLYDWYRYIRFRSDVPQGLTFTDINEWNNRVELGAESEAVREVVLQRLYQLDAPCWLAAISVTGPSVLKDAQPPPAASGIVAP